MDLISAANYGDIRRVRELLDAGVDPNIKDDEGDSALIMATIRSKIDVIRLLLDRGADPNIGDEDGETPLMRASYRNTRDNKDIIKLLLERGADPNIQSLNGDTALTFALSSGNGDIVRLLESHIRSTKIQSRVRGKQTRNKIKTLKALQLLQASQLPTDYDVSRLIGKRISRMPYNPEVAMRIKDEERQDKEIADYLNTLAQYGGKKKRKKTKKRRKSKKKNKSKKKSKKKTKP